MLEKREVNKMSWNCYGSNCSSSSCEMPGRGFLTKKEKIEMLQDYKKQLEREAQGVGERIKEMSEGE